MFTAAELAEHRADAESLMVDTFTAFAPGSPVPGANGMLKVVWIPRGTTLGKTQGSSVSSRDGSTRRVTIGSGEYDVVDEGLHLPLAAFIVAGRLTLARGWEFQCTAVDGRSDAAGLGRRWHVVSVPTKTWPTARRLDVAEVPSLDLT